jgi:hypothetical protein
MACGRRYFALRSVGEGEVKRGDVKDGRAPPGRFCADDKGKQLCAGQEVGSGDRKGSIFCVGNNVVRRMND